MAEQTRQRHDVHALLQRPRRERVSEAVEIGVPDSGLPHAPLEQVLIGAGFVGVAVLLTEHIAVRVINRVLRRDGILNRLVFQQVVEQAFHQIHASAGVVRLGGFHGFYRRGRRDGRVVVRQTVARLADHEHLPVKVDVLPAQSAQFAKAQSREQVEDDSEGGGFRRKPYRRDEPVLLLAVQHAHFRLDQFGDSDALDRIV